ncbi:PAS domain S-box protein [Burkholderiaceae bacterium DAT-1]|nr:PAS domain S-box protein [Burkholderiaceae bacterium DAT-1]
MRTRLRSASLIFILGVGLTFALDAWRQREGEARLLDTARLQGEMRLRNGANLFLSSTSTAEALARFAATEQVHKQRDGLQRFSSSLERLTGVGGVFVAHVVNGDNRREFEAGMRTVYPSYVIRMRNRAGAMVIDETRPRYVAIMHGHDVDRIRLANGQNLAVEPEFAAAIAAMKPGKLVLSAPIHSLQGEIVYVAMYASPEAPDLIGGVILTPAVFQHLDSTKQPIGDFWFDVTDRDRVEPVVPRDVDNANLPASVIAKQHIEIGGRTLRLESRTDDARLSDSMSADSLALRVSGLLLSFAVAMAYAWVTRRDPNLVRLQEQHEANTARMTEMQARLSESDEDSLRLRSIIDSAVDALLLVDDRGNIQLFNHAAEEMFGCDSQEMLGTPLTALFQSYRHRQDDTIIQFLSGGSAVPGGRNVREMLGRRKAGGAFPIELSFNELNLSHSRHYVVLIRDITDRKRAERMLFESEYKHRAILDAAFIGIYVQQDGVLRYVNPTFGNYFGLAPAALVEKVDLAQLVSEQGQRLLVDALDMDHEDAGKPTELLMRRHDGSFFHALLTAKPIIFDNRPGVAGSLLDISGRKAAELAMERAERRNLAMLQAIPDLMMQLNGNGIITDCRSQVPASHFGLPDSCEGSHFKWAFPIEAANRLEHATLMHRAQMATFEYVLKQEDSQRYFEARVTPMPDGEALLMVRDITERKRIEAELIQHRDHLADLVRDRTAELSSLFAASPLPMALQSQGRFVEVNRAFETLFGYSCEEMENQSARNLLADPTQFEATEQRLYTQLITGEVVRVEMIFRAADGGDILCDAFGKSIDNENPHNGAIWIYQDVGEQRAAEAALKEAKEGAESANRAKSQFLANMSHELRTPLHAILSFADLGQTKSRTLEVPKIVHFFERIHQSGLRLLHILNDLLDLAKLESGKMRYEMQMLLLRHVVGEVCEELRTIARPKQVELLVHANEQESPMWGDPFRLAQVVRNLVANAIKYSPDGGVVDLTIRQVGDRIMLLVEDQGVGIPPEELEAVFDKFIQSSKTHTGAGGTGLGLAICREIVLAHGGTIEAENREQQGARLVVCLPVRGQKSGAAAETMTL